MDNRDVARRFEELADILEFLGENAFKIRSYRRAARVLQDLTDNVAEMAAADALRDLPGVGEGIAKKIKEYVETGKITRLEEAKKAAPPGIRDVLRVQSVGPKKAALLYRELGVSDLSALEKAAKEKRIRGLPGMGEKSEENILRGIRVARGTGGRMLLRAALDAAHVAMDELRARPGLVSRVFPAGSLRRWCETVGDVDVLACGHDAAAIIDTFTHDSHVTDVLVAGETKASVLVADGRQVDLRVVAPEQFGSALQYFTGSKAHNIKLRGIARRRGMKINEYGLFRGQEAVASAEEEGIYRELGMEPMPPELREDRGEIEAALSGTLPRLVELDDIRGDFHVHSTWSDGKATIEEIARAARSAGYAFVAITDHSGAFRSKARPSVARLQEQAEEIATVRRRIRGLRLIAGVEVEILPDGSLDLPDEMLAQFDVVIASIHSGALQSRDQIMERLDAATRNPHVDIIGHPKGRLLEQEDKFDVDLPELIRMAAATGTALEINANPKRLDLSDVYCRMAKVHGVRIAIGSDAHSLDPPLRDRIELGVAVARRGWLEADDILNTKPRPVLK